MKENFGNTTGFKVGEYFVSFPPGEFIKEDEDGKLYVMVDIFLIDKNNKATKVEQSTISPELEEQISLEINKFLTAAIDNEKNSDINK